MKEKRTTIKKLEERINFLERELKKSDDAFSMLRASGVITEDSERILKNIASRFHPL